MLRKLGALLFVALLACAASSIVAANTFYVSTGGSDTNDGLTPDTAWKTIDNGDRNKLVAYGDTVNVLPGVYAGTRGDGVTLVNVAGVTYQGNGAVIDMTNAPRWGNNTSQGVYMTTAETTFQGFEIIGAEFGINMGGGGSSVIANNIIHGQRPAQLDDSVNIYFATGSGIMVAGSHFNTIRNNVIYDVQKLTGATVNVATCISDVWSANANIVNNTLIGSDYGVHQGWTESTTWAAFLYNNIVKDMSVEGVSGGMAGYINLFYSNNLFYNNTANYGGSLVSHSGDVFADPELLANFHLGVGSPAIDAGIDKGLPFNGLAPDMGAFETVPEPGSILALVAGLAGLGGLCIRRRS